MLRSLNVLKTISQVRTTKATAAASQPTNTSTPVQSLPMTSVESNPVTNDLNNLRQLRAQLGRQTVVDANAVVRLEGRSLQLGAENSNQSGATFQFPTVPTTPPIRAGIAEPAVPTTPTQPTTPAQPAQPTAPAPNNQQNPQQSNIDALGVLNTNFDQVDADNNGFVSEQEITNFQNQQQNLSGNIRNGLNNVRDSVPELMYTTIQDGDEALFGIGRDDINATTERLQNGETLGQIKESVLNDLFPEEGSANSIFLNIAGGDKARALRLFLNSERRAVRKFSRFRNGG